MSTQKAPKVDPRIMRIIKKKAFKATLPLLIPFSFILLVLMGDIFVVLLWAIPFSVFWISTYRSAQYFFLSKRYPDKFPKLVQTDENNASSLNILSDPSHQAYHGNIFYRRNHPY
jgi:hypothetical protein